MKSNELHIGILGAMPEEVVEAKNHLKEIEINREDEADALVSAAALRLLSSNEELWSAPKSFETAIKAEGWIFGVK